MSGVIEGQPGSHGALLSGLGLLMVFEMQNLKQKNSFYLTSGLEK